MTSARLNTIEDSLERYFLSGVITASCQLQCSLFYSNRHTFGAFGIPSRIRCVEIDPPQSTEILHVEKTVRFAANQNKPGGFLLSDDVERCDDISCGLPRDQLLPIAIKHGWLEDELDRRSAMRGDDIIECASQVGFLDRKSTRLN